MVGKGLAPNRGTRKGNIVNVEATVEALKQASEEAEVMAGVEISRAYVGVAGADIRSVNSRGMVSVSRKDREITRQDIQRVLEAAQSAALPSDREILHAIPQEFIVDEQGGIDDPLGMLGTRLEVMVHLVTGNITRSRTLLTCVNRAGIEVVEMVFEPLATAEAVLTPDERELGVLLGRHRRRHHRVRPLRRRRDPVQRGGADRRRPLHQRPRDGAAHAVRRGRADQDQAGLLPAQHGDRRGGDLGPHGGRRHARGWCRSASSARSCSRAPRSCSTWCARTSCKHATDEGLRGGVVLTGGGAQLDGLLELAEQIFDAGVRYGLPRGLGGLVDVISSPTWSTASGPAALRPGRRGEPGQGAEEERDSACAAMVGSLRGMFSDLL